MKPAESNSTGPPARFYQFGPFRLDAARRVLLREGELLPLTPKAFDTLLLLVERPGELVTKDELMGRLWPDTFVEEGSLTRNISALRKALGENPREHRYIATVPGRGYRFVARVARLTGETGNLRLTERTTTSITFTEEAPDDREGPPADDAISSADRVVPVAVELPVEETRTALAQALPLQPGAGRRFALPRVLAFAAVLLIAMTATAFVVYKLIGAGAQSETPPPLDITRLTTTGNISNGRPAISPDGRFVVYAVMDSPRTSSLWLRQLATHSADQLIAPAAVDYSGAAFSRDGNHIYYTAREKDAAQASLYRIPLVKGPPRKLLDEIEGPVSFSPDGSRFVFHRLRRTHQESALVVADAEGGHQQEVALLKYPEFFGEPAWSPDGRLIACGAGHADGGANRYLVQVSVDDWAVREVSGRRWRWVGPVEWLADGKGLLMIASDHVAATYQIWHLPYPVGEARRLTNETLFYSRMGLAAESDALVAAQVRQVTNIWLVPADEPALARRLTFGSGGYRARLGWTRDRKIVFESALTGTPDISMMNEDGSDQRHLLGDLAGRAAAGSPSATPDGAYVVFTYDVSNRRHIWRINSDGSNPLQLTDGNGEDLPQCSADGRWVIYTDIGAARPALWRVAIDGGEPVPLTTNAARQAAISPDGKFIACFYASAQTDRQEHIAILPATGGDPIKIFAQPLERPTAIKWTPDGRGIAYVDSLRDASNIWLQPVSGGDPRPLTRFDSDQIFGFAWSPDGKHLACTRGIWERNLVLIKNFK